MADDNKICTCTTPEYTINLNKQGPPGVKGDTGENGFSPVINVIQNTPSEYILNIATAEGTITTPNLKGNLPTGGSTGMVLTKNSDVNGDASFSPLPNASTENPGVVQLATTDDFIPDEEGNVNNINAVTPDVLNAELKTQVNTFIVAGENITTSVDEEGKVTVNATAEPYTLPQADATTLGGIKANPTTDEDTQAVNIDPTTGLLYTKAGGGVTDAYTKAETDALLEAKQDILTPVQPLTLQNKILSNLVGFEYTTDGQGVYTTNTNAYSGVYINSGFVALGDNICVTKSSSYSGSQTWSNDAIPSRIVIPYTFGQIIKFPYANNNNPGFAFWGYNTATNNYYPIFNPYEEDRVTTLTDGVYLDGYGFKFGEARPSSTYTSDKVSGFTNAYVQLIRNASTFTLIIFKPDYNSKYKYEITSSFTKLNEIDSFIITPTTKWIYYGGDYGTSESTAIPISSIGLYEYDGDFYSVTNPDTVLTNNLFDLSGQTAKNYLEVQVDGTTITTNSDGQLQTIFPTNLTTQGNTFNGASQLVQLDSAGKLPAIDGSQLTNLPTGAVGFPASTTPPDYNMNNLITEGLYYFSGSIIPQNPPTGSNITGYLMVLSLPKGNKVKQIFFEANGNKSSEANTHNNMYMRVCISNNSTGYGWSNWVQLVSTSNISTLVPTGSLKYWTGTEADYTAIATKNANTLYRLTDTNTVYLGTIQLSN